MSVRRMMARADAAKDATRGFGLCPEDRAYALMFAAYEALGADMARMLPGGADSPERGPVALRALADRLDVETTGRPA